MPPPELVDDPCPRRRPPRTLNVAPSLLEHCPEVRNYPLAFLAPISFPLRRISSHRSRCAPIHRACSVSGRFSPDPCMCFGPRHPTPLIGACAGFGTPDHPSTRPRFLAGVPPTCPERPLCHSPASSSALTARTPPSSSSGPLTGHGQLHRPQTLGARACLVSGNFTITDGSSANHLVVNPPCA